MTEVYDRKVSLVVPSEMDEWLKEHKEINKSKLFRDAVNKIRYPVHEPLSDAIIINFSIMVTVISGFFLIFLYSFINIIFLIMLWLLLTCILVVTTIVVIVKRRSNRKWQNNQVENKKLS